MSPGKQIQAQLEESQVPPGDDYPIMVFQVGDRYWGTPLTQVLEVLIPEFISRVPGDLKLVEGIVSRWEEIFVVIRLQALLESNLENFKFPDSISGRDFGMEERVVLFHPILVSGGWLKIGFRVDRVGGIFKKEDVQIEPQDRVISGLDGNSIISKIVIVTDRKGEAIEVNALNLSLIRNQVLQDLAHPIFR